MNLDDLTLGQAKQLVALIGTGSPTFSEAHPYPVGDNVFIRTVTMHYTGKIESVTDSDIVLSDAAWIADSGRFSEALRTGSLAEVEPYPYGCIVARGGLLDVSPWRHPLPRDTK